jgi:hypothetical protein
MESSSSFIFPIPPTGKSPRIALPTFDLQQNHTPLLRFKVTYLTCSEEYVLDISFSHVLGDVWNHLHQDHYSNGAWNQNEKLI